MCISTLAHNRECVASTSLFTVLDIYCDNWVTGETTLSAYYCVSAALYYIVITCTLLTVIKVLTTIRLNRPSKHCATATCYVS